MLKLDASFLIEGFSLSLDCDHQLASARLSKVENPLLLMADTQTLAKGCI